MAFHKINYPIYAASFDPHNSDFLFVGGGGGEGRSGVPNKISLLDTSNAAGKNELREVTHIDLTTEEDSVSSLAVAKSSETEAILFAGINSSEKQQKAGVNEHLRAIKVPYPQRRTAPSGTATSVLPPAAALSKASIFSIGEKKETYQRVLRISPASTVTTKRLGAIATGFSPVGEVVLFDATVSTPSQNDVLQRISLGNGEEAGDIDILETGEGEFRVTYCTDTRIHCVDVTFGKERTKKEPFVVFEGSKNDGSFRSVRFLTKNIVASVRNFPRKRGAQIFVVQCPNDSELGRPLFVSGLPSGFNAATALDVAVLPAIVNSSKSQFLLAASGQNDTIVLYTIDYTPTGGNKLTGQRHTVYRNIHPAGITSLAFSKFPSPTNEVPGKPIRVKLASTSFGNSVVVHTLPLKPRPTPRKPTHMVLAKPPERSLVDDAAWFLTGSLILAVISMLVMAVGELTGQIQTQRLGIRNWAPDEIKELFDVPRAVGRPIASAPAVVTAPVVVSSMPPVEPAAAERAASRKAAKEAGAASSLGDVVSAVTEEGAASAASAASAIGDTVSIVTEEGAASAASVASEISDTASIVTKEGVASAASAASVISDKISAITEITQQIPTAVSEAAEKVEYAAGSAQQKVMKAKTNMPNIARAKIANILKAHRGKNDPESSVKAPAAVMFRDSEHGLSVSTHEHEGHAEDAGAKKWEHLSTEEQHLWRHRLKQAGHWVEGETEAVLKGVFFGTLAGVVGAAVRG